MEQCTSELKKEQKPLRESADIALKQTVNVEVKGWLEDKTGFAATDLVIKKRKVSCTMKI